MADLKELALQEAAKDLLDQTDLVWFHPVNEGKRTKWERAKFHSSGGKKGVHDILIFNSTTIPGSVFKVKYSFFEQLVKLFFCERYKGVSIELKIGTRKLTDEQADWKKKFISVGWKFLICYTIDELWYVLTKYYPSYVSHIKF